MRINDRTAVLLNGYLKEDLHTGESATILKINSHADLIKYGSNSSKTD